MSLQTIKHTNCTAEELLARKMSEHGYIIKNGILTETLDVSNPYCLAKKQTIVNGQNVRSKFFIKTDVNHDFYNPWGTETIIRKAEELPSWQFVEVNGNIFKQYIYFLETKNEFHLTASNHRFKNVM